MSYLMSSVRKRGFCNVLQKTVVETKAASPLLLPEPLHPSGPLSNERHSGRSNPRPPTAGPAAAHGHALKTDRGGSSPFMAFSFMTGHTHFVFQTPVPAWIFPVPSGYVHVGGLQTRHGVAWVTSLTHKPL